MSEQAPRVAVVGAGLAGLAAVLTLTNGGARVEILERSRLLGGKATSFTVDGTEVDNGQHVILGCCDEFLAFLSQLRMSGTLRMQERFEVTVLSRDRRPSRLAAAPLPAPLHLMPSFARYAHLSWPQKLRVGRALLAARLDTSPSGDMASWLRSKGQGDDERRAFWDPFLVPALNAPLEDAAASDGLFVIRTAFLSDRGAARIGYSTVPLARVAEAAAARAEAVHLRTAVVSLEADGARASSLRTDNDDRHAFDGYVLAVPPRRLAMITGASPGLRVSGLSAFRTQPIVDVHLWYERSGPGNLLGEAGFAALLGSPVQWVFEKAPGYLCCSLSAAGDAIARPERELVELCDAELAAVLPALRTAKLRRGAATRDPEATFVPAPGLRRPGPHTSLDNVMIAGAWTDTGWPATMESAVRSGNTAAIHLLGALERAQPRTTAAGERAQELAGAL